MSTSNACRIGGIILCVAVFGGLVKTYWHDLPWASTDHATVPEIITNGHSRRIPIDVGTVWPKSATSKKVVIKNDSTVPWTLALLRPTVVA